MIKFRTPFRLKLEYINIETSYLEYMHESSHFIQERESEWQFLTQEFIRI